MARRGRLRGPKKPKRKKPSYELIDRKSVAGEPIYEMLGELVEKYHDEVLHARFAVAWNLTWKPDVDGRVKLGHTRKASDLDRELVDFDFVIILQREFWMSPAVSDAQRRALLDHQLTHASVKLDKEGEPALDEKDRVIYRIRKHDVEEFSSVIERHGLYKRYLEEFAAAIRRAPKIAKQKPFDFEGDKPAPPPAPGKEVRA